MSEDVEDVLRRAEDGALLKIVLEPVPGPHDLTPRQREVAALVADGLTDKAIGGRLGMAQNTVRVHVVALAFRMKIPAGQNTRVLIAEWWRRHGAPSTRTD